MFLERAEFKLIFADYFRGSESPQERANRLSNAIDTAGQPWHQVRTAQLAVEKYWSASHALTVMPDWRKYSNVVKLNYYSRQHIDWCSEHASSQGYGQGYLVESYREELMPANSHAWWFDDSRTALLFRLAHQQ